jgi:hypothetical protein
MNSANKLFILVGVVVAQLIMIQVVTFIVSFLLPGMGDSLPTLPSYIVFVLGITFAVGIFLPGWFAIKQHWLDLAPKYLARLVGALVGAALPMIVALLGFGGIEPGSPFFFVSYVVGILGFFLPGWIGK